MCDDSDARLATLSRRTHSQPKDARDGLGFPEHTRFRHPTAFFRIPTCFSIDVCMIYDLQSTDDPRDIVHRSVQALVEGQLVGLPSETVYGLVASSLCPAAVEVLISQTRQAYKRLRDASQGDNPASNLGNTSDSRIGVPLGSFGLSVRSGEATEDFILPVTELTRRLRERCFPGPLTLIADCGQPGSAVERLPESVQSHLVDAATGISGTEKDDSGGGQQKEIAIRVADHRILSHIHRYLAAPLVWAELPAMPSSGQADHSGVGASPLPSSVESTPTVAGRPEREGENREEAISCGSPITTAKGLKTVLELADTESSLPWPPLLLDDGITRYGGWGTVVRATGRTWTVVRDGVIQRAAMNQFAKPVIAIVCTGNTCRSPMGEMLLRKLLLERFGREDIAQVVSAGLAASHGGGATPQAVEVMGRLGLDLTGHCSRPLDDSLMSMADLVLTMTRRHREAILAAWPDRADRVFNLRRDGGDISDPVGMPVDVYSQCAEQIRRELSAWVDSLGESFFPIEAPKAGSSRHNSETGGANVPAEADCVEPTDRDDDRPTGQDNGDGGGPMERPER